MTPGSAIDIDASPVAADWNAALHERVARLPVLPAVVRTLSALDPDADDYFDQALRMAQADPGFAARLLHLANSASQRAARPASSIHLALMRVGARAAVDLQLTAALVHVFQPRHAWQRRMWAHSVFAACMMRRLAPLMADARLDAGEAYMAGLLRDVGGFLLVAAELGQAAPVVAAQLRAKLGYAALMRWCVPEPVARAVRDHHLAGELQREGSLTTLLRDVDELAETVAQATPEWFDQPAAQVERVLARVMSGRYRGDLTGRSVALRTAAIEAQALLDAIGLGAPCYCAAA